MTAPRIPANSGSRLSPAVKRAVLKRTSTPSAASSLSSQAISLSLTRRWSSGTSREIPPFTKVSMSSELRSQTRRVLPTIEGSARTRSRSSRPAPEETRP